MPAPRILWLVRLVAMAGAALVLLGTIRQRKLTRQGAAEAAQLDTAHRRLETRLTEQEARVAEARARLARPGASVRAARVDLAAMEQGLADVEAEAAAVDSQRQARTRAVAARAPLGRRAMTLLGAGLALVVAGIAAEALLRRRFRRDRLVAGAG